MSRIVVTGGAGFVGSHLCEALLERGDAVVAVDNFSTSSVENVDHLMERSDFELVVADVVQEIPVGGPVDGVLHLASPASPPEYLSMPLETLDVSSIGTRRALDLAHANDAPFLLASTSEVYGDPLVHPQPESYFGNVDPVGPRAVYDEAKRFAETLTMTYHRLYGLPTRIVRIFNTYGPRLRPADGRVVSNFLVQAIAGEPLTVYGEGTQTRSFCFVEDEVRGILALFDSQIVEPVNIGNPVEYTCWSSPRSLRRRRRHLRARVRNVARRRSDETSARHHTGATALGLGAEDRAPRRAERTHAWYLEERARGRSLTARHRRLRKLSVIVPVFNERNTVVEVLRRMRGRRASRRARSRDYRRRRRQQRRDPRRAQSAPRQHVRILLHDDNRGKGAAVRTGLTSRVTGDYVLIQDADLEYDPEDWPKLARAGLRGRAQVVYGSRFTGERRNMLFLHWIGNRMLSFVTNVLYNSTLSDMETCHKLVDRELLLDLRLRCRRFDFEPEITAKILKTSDSHLRGSDLVHGPRVRRRQEDHVARWLRGVVDAGQVPFCRLIKVWPIPNRSGRPGPRSSSTTRRARSSWTVCARSSPIRAPGRLISSWSTTALRTDRSPTSAP